MNDQEKARVRFQHALKESEETIHELANNVAGFIAESGANKDDVIARLVREFLASHPTQIAFSLAVLVEKEARSRVVFVPAPKAQGKGERT